MSTPSTAAGQVGAGRAAAHAAELPITQASPGDTRRWWILAIIGIAQLMLVLDSPIVNIALPNAQRALHFADGDRVWIVTAYALTFGSFLLLGGRLGDIFGRKSVHRRAGRVRGGVSSRRRRPRLRRPGLCPGGAGTFRRAARAVRPDAAGHDLHRRERAGPGLWSAGAADNHRYVKSTALRKGYGWRDCG